MPISHTSERSPTPGRTAIAAPRATLPAPRRSSLWSFLDTLAYPAFIDTLWRLPRNPDQAMYNLWQLARLVHDVAAIQEVGIAKLLTGEPGRNGDDLHPGRQRPLHPRRGVFDRQAPPASKSSSRAARRCISGSGFPWSTSSRVTTTSNSSSSPRMPSTRLACSRWDWVARAVEKPSCLTLRSRAMLWE